MLPGNVDPRRPDKVQRYKPPTTNGNGQGEDLTPDYMNILGQRATTANATTEFVNDNKLLDGAGGGVVVVEPNLHQQVTQQHLQQQQQQHRINEDKLIQQQQQHQVVPIKEEILTDYSINTNTATNVIPTSPQYGVAIISSSPSSSSSASSTTNNTTTTDNTIPNEIIINHDNNIIIDNNTKITDDNSSNNNSNKDNNTLHTTPSKNDRFKVVKIASLEPFKRGRWKCMDYMDEVPNPPSTINQQTKIAQSTNNIPVSGGVYLQTQSLPQQQIQQMLLQSGYTNGTQYFNNQMLPPQAQFFYQPGANITQTLPQQLINASVGIVQQQPQQQSVPSSSSIPTQYINTTQPYITGGCVIQQNSTGGYTVHQPNYQPNVQYIPQNVIPPQQQQQQQNQTQQNPAFVPTSQTVQLTNFQQSQTYSGQPNVSQSNVVTQQPMVNGHAYPPPQQQQQPSEQQVSSSSVVQNQTVKNVIINNNVQQPIVSQPQIVQQIPSIQSSTPSQTIPVPVIQQQQTQYQNTQNFQPQQQQQIPNQQTQQQIPNQQTQQQIPNQQTQSNTTTQLPTQTINQTQQQQQQQPVIQVQQVVSVPSQTFEQNQTNVYTNPLQNPSTNSMTTILENCENLSDINDSSTSAEITTSDSIATTTTTTSDDPSKTNPVVNAIDNKIEQAMDLVKSHLMYTVREEVEVLKEKIAELMERIQQLETENNYLRSQIPKNMILNNNPILNNSNVSCNVVTTTASTQNVITNQTTNTIASNSNIGGSNINETQQQ